MFFIILVFYIFSLLKVKPWPRNYSRPTKHIRTLQDTPILYSKNRRKPQWVVDKVIYLKAISNNGCGKVAECFNQLHGDKQTVSKTFVYEKLKNHQYELMAMKRQIKNKPPRVVPVNQTWGIDLTTVTLNKKQKLVLGIIDHGSRMNLRLTELNSKHSARIILQVCKAIKQFGFPKFVRTDNELCFTSHWMTLCLKLLGIKHQKTPIASPWCNGRIERFFGSFKEKINQLIFPEGSHFQSELNIFNAWYNHIRTHENIAGLTPAEMWQGRLKRHKNYYVEVSDWDGLLTGYYFPD